MYQNNFEQYNHMQNVSLTLNSIYMYISVIVTYEYFMVPRDQHNKSSLSNFPQKDSYSVSFNYTSVKDKASYNLYIVNSCTTWQRFSPLTAVYLNYWRLQYSNEHINWNFVNFTKGKHCICNNNSSYFSRIYDHLLPEHYLVALINHSHGKLPSVHTHILSSLLCSLTTVQKKADSYIKVIITIKC
jgi:hypothetical protein